MRWLVFVLMATLVIVENSFAMEKQEQSQGEYGRLLDKLTVLEDSAMNKNVNDMFEYFVLVYNNQEMLGEHAQKAYDFLLVAGGSSHSGAQFMLASLFYNGRWVEKNHDDALFWALKSAHAGEPRAQFMVGSIYYLKFRLEETDLKLMAKYFQESVFWYRKANSQGFGMAKVRLGAVLVESSRTEKEGIEILNELVKGGNIEAMEILGTYHKDEWIRKSNQADYETAMKLLRKAAESGSEIVEQIKNEQKRFNKKN